MAALNRSFAVSKARSVQEAIIETEKLQLVTNPYYFTLLGELYKNTDAGQAKNHFVREILLTKTKADRTTIERKISAL